MSDALTSAAVPPASLDEWLAAIRRANGNEGDFLAAYDLAVQALAAWPDAMVLEHQAMLALARAGALNRALQRYRALEASGRLEALGDAPGDTHLAAEFAGLHGRLLKDRAASAPAAERQQHTLGSATAYASAFEQLGKYYLAINAASMYLAAARTDLAERYARAALRLAAAQSPPDYWSLATQAEASLILGEHAAADAFLSAAATDKRRTIAATGVENLDEVASTRRQLSWVAALVGAPPALLERLPKPRVLNWTSPADGTVAGAAVALVPGQTTIAFGSLLSLADLHLASTLLAAGAKVHLVLPYEPALFAERMLVGQPTLRANFERLLADHHNVRLTLVTGEGPPHEPAAALMCRQQARGLALLRARGLAVTAELLTADTAGYRFGAIPDDNADIVAEGAGDGADGAGAAADGASGAATGDAAGRAGADAVGAPRLMHNPAATRTSHAIVFGDVRGFSALSEAEQLAFLDHIIGGFAQALADCGRVEYAETAGDGLFIVVTDVLAAIDCCVRLQQVLLPARVAAAGLPAHLGIRLSAHVGPLYRRFDKVIERFKFVGMEVIRTARIEPVTPVGEIFVTEQFAAALAFSTRDAYVCEYAGRQPMAKNFGECRMYSLRAAGG